MAVVPMCHALMGLGVEPLIVTTDADGDGRLDVPLGERTTWKEVPAIFFERNFSEAFKYSSALASWLRAHVASFDVVHIHAVLSHACLAAAAACRANAVPFVVRPLGTLAPWSLSQKPLRKRLMLMLGGRAAIVNAGAVHCTSEDERRGIMQAFPAAHAVVIPLGLDDDYLAAPEADWTERHRDRYVLAISRLHPKKNLEMLIDAFLRVASARSERWRLVIAGDGDSHYVQQLQTRAGRGVADGLVSFPGWVEGARKHALLQGASLFALASFHENFGVSVLEALACGVPALVSSNVDLAAVIQQANAGWVVAPDANSIARGFSEALSNADERASRGRSARTVARRFAWPGIADELVTLYRGLMAGRAPAGDPVLSPATPTGR